MKVLNVGAGSKLIKMPAFYSNWEQVYLDIDKTSGADLICDARELDELVESQFDAIYCSHNLEHYYRHDLAKVLQGFKHVLNDTGFCHISVPNMQFVFKKLASGADIEDVMYVSPAGPIKAVDMIYGLGAYIEHSGNDFMAHKNGFTPKSLGEVLYNNGFPNVFIGEHDFDLFAFAFKTRPSVEQMASLHLKEAP